MPPIIAIWELPAPIPSNDGLWNESVCTEWAGNNFANESISTDPGLSYYIIQGGLIADTSDRSRHSGFD